MTDDTARGTRNRRAFTILWWGHFAAMAAMEMSGPFWPVYLRDLGDFGEDRLIFWSGLLYAAPLTVAIFSAPFWGSVGDRLGHKAMLLRAVAALALTQALVAATHDPYWLLAWRVLQGACAGVITAAMAYIVCQPAIPQKGKAIAKLQGATAAGSLLGPILGGLVATEADFATIFLASSGLCLGITLLFAVSLPRAPITAREKPSSGAKRALPRGNGLALLGALFLAITLAQTAKMMPTPYFALFVEEVGTQQGEEAISPNAIGLLYAMTGLAVAITAPLWGRIIEAVSETGLFAALALAALCAAALLWAHGQIESLLALAALRFAWGLCLGAFLPGAFYFLRTAYQASGQLIGLGNSSSKLGNLIGHFLGSAAAITLGLAASFEAIALLYLLLALLFAALALVRQSQSRTSSQQAQTHG